MGEIVRLYGVMDRRDGKFWKIGKFWKNWGNLEVNKNLTKMEFRRTTSKI